ncbi:TonB-dependent receptor [Bacteroidia bacterium]|nr:TonB-dependent receptor [Bacteroidia bacterium]
MKIKTVNISLHFMKQVIIAFIVILFVFSNSIFAQATFKGVIRDSLGETIPYATVTVRTKDNRSIVVGTMANFQGEYSIAVNKTGNFNLIFSALTYLPSRHNISVENDNKEHIVNARLRSNPTLLEPVEIVAHQPIEIHGDTVIYRVANFATGREIVMEDLMRNLPGFQVLSDGRIMVGTRMITKVLIEGADFLGDAYSILSQGLRADAIEKIEVIDHYNENRLLKKYLKKGYSVINVRLKKEFLLQCFGNLDASIDMESLKHYQIKGNLMMVGKKFKMANFVNVNSIGERTISSIENTIRSSNYEITKMSGSSAANMLFFEGERPNLNEQRTNLNYDKMLTITAIYNPFKRLKIQSAGIFNADVLDFYNEYIQNYSIENQRFTNTTTAQRQLKKLFALGELDATWDIAKNFILDYSFRYHYLQQNGLGDVSFNNDTTSQVFRSYQERWEQKFCLTSNLNEMDVLLFKGVWTQEKYPQSQNTNKFYYADLFSDFASGTATTQNTLSKSSFGGLELLYLHNFYNGAVLDVNCKYSIQKDNFLSDFSIFQGDVFLGIPDSLQNNFGFLNHDISIGSSLQYPIIKELYLNASISGNILNNTINSNDETKKTIFYINPSLSLNYYSKNRKHYTNTSLSYNSMPSTILDVIDYYIESSERYFSKGYKTLETLKNLSVASSYNYRSDKRISFSATISYTNFYDFYSSNSWITHDYTFSEKTLAHNYQTAGVYIDPDFFLNFIKSNLKLQLRYNFSTLENNVNNNSRNIFIHSCSYKAELRSAFASFFNYHIGTEWNTSHVLAENNIFFNLQSISFLDLHFQYNDFIASIKNEIYDAKLSNATHNINYFLDIVVSYKIPKENVTIGLSGLNLLNTKNFISTNITDVFSSKAIYRIQHRMIMLQIAFKF